MTRERLACDALSFSPGVVNQLEQTNFAFDEQGDHIVIDKGAFNTFSEFASSRSESRIRNDDRSMATVKLHASVGLLHGGIADRRAGVALGLNRPISSRSLKRSGQHLGLQ